MKEKDSVACRRRHILGAAERLLRHYGPSKTTVADIAKAANVGVGTIYLEFPSKDAILVALSEERCGAIFGAMQSAALGEGRHAERLGRILELRLDAFLELADAGVHAVDLVHCTACPAIHGVWMSFESRQRVLFRELLREASEAGVFSCRDPERSAGALLQAFSAFTPPVLYSRPLEGMRTEQAALLELIILGLARR
ncbi:MAG TPA: TetR/AcrR family transcriptional regulator [Nannocystis exedens]|nr:TetR/AcrR family transcriptional regulator [Nannocystis exedens]